MKFFCYALLTTCAIFVPFNYAITNNSSPWHQSYQSQKNSEKNSNHHDKNSSLIKIFPGPLFSLGQNILDEGEFSIAVYDEYDQAEHTRLFLNEFTIYYGITGGFSFTLYIPILALNKQDGQQSTGLSNVLPQFEYVWYLQETEDAYNRGTVFAGTTFPVIQKRNPPLGSPAWGVLVGTTACHNSTNVYCFGSAAALLFMHDKNRFGNQYYYEMGIGTTIKYKPNSYHLSTIFEFNGIYFCPRRVDGFIDPNSGFNVIFFGPDIRLRIDKCLFQVGIQFPIAQNLFGIQQNTIDYRMAISLTWEF